MAHPQHNFTSNFNGSEGNNAELTLNINGVEKKYTPAGNDQTYNVPGVARIDINLDGADLVQAIQTALDGAAQPVLVEMSIYDEEYVYQYIGDIDGQWYFGTCTATKIVTITVAKEDGAVNGEQIPVANGVVIVESDGLNVYSRLRTALALGQLPVLSYVGANPVYAQYEKTADNGDLIFVGALASASDTYVQYNIYTVASNNTVTVTTRAASAGGGGTPDDENGFFNSSLYQTPGDGVTESLTLNDFRIKQGTSIHGSNIEFVPTHQDGGVDFGEVYLNPGTYILNIRYTLQWVGNPRGTFAPLVCRVGTQPFDFSFEQENTLVTSQIRVVTARQKVSIAFPFDADTPPMGIWVETLSIAQLASNTHPAVVHDTTLAGSGTAGSPLGVTTDVFGKIKDIPTSISQFRTGDVIPVDGPNGPAKMPKDDLLTETAQNALAGNVAPEFIPNSTTTVEGQPYIYNGSLYIANETYRGPWDASKFTVGSVKYFIDSLLNISRQLAGHNDVLTGTGQLFPGIVGEKMVAINEATYNIIPSKTTWGSSYGDTITIFAVQKIYADGTTADAIYYRKSDKILPVITFTLNDANAKYLRIFYRGDASEVVTFTWNPCSQGDTFNAARLSLKNFSETLIGNINSGGALVGKYGSLVPAVAGFTYSIMPSKTKWKTNNISPDSVAIFDIVKVYADGATAVDVEYNKSDYIPEVVHYTCTDESAKWIRVFLRADSGEEVSFTWNSDVFSSIPADHRQMTSYCRSVNHRGYSTIAPENTIPAFILSKKMGFDTIELDVRTTSDGKFVCCHDATVDRTSDGTGTIANMTLAQLKALDFGSWKSAVYAGTKIPTFEEALICCRNMGLNVYIDLAAVSNVLDLVKLVNHYGMKERVTFISDLLYHLQNLQTNRPGQYRIGYVCGSLTQTIKNNIVALDAGLGNVFLDIYKSSLTSTDLDDMKALGISVEIWTENSVANTKALSQGVSGMTSDEVIFGLIKYNQEICNS